MCFKAMLGLLTCHWLSESLATLWVVRYLHGLPILELKVKPLLLETW